jgi:hypothetical protein
MIRWKFLPATALALLAVSWIPISHAQAQGAPAEGAQPASAYSDSELKSFAVAALDVQRINQAYLPKLQAAGTAEEQQQVRQEATQEMVKAVQKQGMSVDKFNEIAVQARQRPEIAERIQRHIVEEAK